MPEKSKNLTTIEFDSKNKKNTKIKKKKKKKTEHDYIWYVVKRKQLELTKCLLACK